MILQALNDYYQRCQRSPNPQDRLPAFGLEEKEIPFIIEIDTEGRLVNLADTRTLEGKKKVGGFGEIQVVQHEAQLAGFVYGCRFGGGISHQSKIRSKFTAAEIRLVDALPTAGTALEHFLELHWRVIRRGVG